MTTEEKREVIIDDGRIESIEEFQTPEALYEELINRVRKYHPSDDISLIEKAYQTAYEAHKDQVRKSGEPYIIHPLYVSIILADLELDKETIVAGLLHDVVEDTIMTDEQIKEEFGADVALLVDGVTKLEKLNFHGENHNDRDKDAEKLERQAENLRKMFLAMAKDIRVILIKLADRLHNMRTLQHMRPEKQQEIARETLDIYSPIAQRLGISKICLLYCFTPTGDVKNLPAGSTTIDFAYSIHSAVGNRMIGARVNGKLVTIDYEIKNGDRVEIMTSQNSKGPSRDWLNVVKSTQAKNKINQWFKHELKDDNIVKGKELIANYCKAKSINAFEVVVPKYQEAIMKKYGFQDWESVLAAIGHGGLKEGQILNRMQEMYDHDHRREMTDAEVMAEVEGNALLSRGRMQKGTSGILVKGIHDVAVRFSKCCSPVPGDEIVGFVTRGRGISIHRTDCLNIMNLPEIDRNRLIDAEWQQTEEVSGKYFAEISIFANNRNGLLADISRALTEKEIDILSLNTRVSKQGTATIMVSFEIGGREELQRIIDKIRTIESVIDIERTTG